MVGEEQNASAGRSVLDQVQPLQVVPFPVQALAAIHDHWMNHQTEFVEKVMLYQGLNQTDATSHANVLAGLTFELIDLIREIALEQ